MNDKKVELSEQSKAVFDVVTNDQKTYKKMISIIKSYRNGGYSWVKFKDMMKHNMNILLSKEESSLALSVACGYTYRKYSQLDHLCNTLLHYYSQEVFGFEFRQWCDALNAPPTEGDVYRELNKTINAEFKLKNKPFKQEKQPMKSIIKIENKVLVNGTDVATMSDDTIFDQIATSEAEITRLEAIKAKPKKLTARIEEIQDGIAGLVKIVDGRK